MSAPVTYDQILKTQRHATLISTAQFILVAALTGVAAWHAGLLDIQRLKEGVPDLISLCGEMLPPDFSRWRTWLVPILDTLAMSITGTALAVAFSFPLALLAARNTTPHPVVYHVARSILNITRAVPELILGIILVAAVGFGVLPGALALGIHSIGMVGKFFAESIEHTDPHPVEAVTASGASKLQVIGHGILPQVIPQMVDTTCYRWEYNFRASTVLGAVGAGGIGFQLIGALRVLNYQEMFAIILVVLVMVTLVDRLGSALRVRFK